MKKIYTLLVFLALWTGLQAQDYTVTVQSNTFTPDMLTINVGETVLFDNIAGFHNVNGTQTTNPSNPESFGNGGATSAPWNYQHTFTLPGTYSYQCDPHVGLGMTGTIIVNEAENNNDDIVITEIMYNPPEAGTDSLEYIELYNKGTETVDMAGWSFTAGVDFIFPDGAAMNGGDYLVVAVNSVAMQTVFGITTLQWTSGGLSNGGETIELSDANGTVVDIVAFDDVNGWPTEPDGSGASLVLCDPASDNNSAASWLAATTATGYLIDGTEVLANPGATSDCSDAAVVRFVDSSVNVDEDAGTITAMVSIAFGNANPTSVDVSVDMSSTATEGADFTFAATTLTFDGGVTNDTLSITMDITDDTDIEAIETAVLVLSNATNGAAIVAAGETFTATITDNDTPLVDLFFTEIMYNDPTGPDTLEFLEIYNNEATAVDLSGFSITQGVVFTFPDGSSVDAGGYVYVAKHGAYFEEVFGVAAFTWTSGSLTNSGEDVEITDAAGNILNNVDYDDAGEWPVGADGGGASLALCDITADNSLAASWGLASESTGVLLEGVEILASINGQSVCQVIAEPTYPNYGISEVTTVNENGIVDSVNVTCTLTGIVYGVDLNGADEAVQFFIHDGTDGIGVYQGALADYVVTEGDEVSIQGSIGQFNGLTQISPISIVLNSSNNDLLSAQSVTELNEETESELITLQSVEYVDINQWMPAGAGFTMELTDGTNTYTMYIDNDTDLFQLSEAPFASSAFMNLFVSGMGSQYDTSNPYTEGYQIVPRYISDIVNLTNTIDITLAEKIQMFPNPAQEVLNIRAEEVEIDAIRITNVLGQIVLTVKNPSNQLDISSLAAGIYTVTFTSGDSLFAQQLVKK